MKNLAKLLLVASYPICAFLSFDLLAQADSIISRQFKVRDGLTDDQVESIFQDEEGFIWIRTFAALHKYDGYKFFKHSYNPGSSELLERRARIFCQDKRGRFWITDGGGLAVFNPVTETFDFRFPPDSFRGRLRRLRVRKDGDIWICTNQGVYLVNAETFLIKPLDYLPVGLRYSDIAETRDGSLWINTTEALIEIDSTTKHLTVHKPNYRKSQAGVINPEPNFVVMADSRDRLWLATNSGLGSFNREGKTFHQYLPDVVVFNFIEAADGKLWVTSSKGLFVFDPETTKYHQVTNVWAESIIQDKQGIIWIGTLAGVSQINPQTYKIGTDQRFGKLVGKMIEDSNQRIWMIVSVSHAITRSKLFSFDGSLDHIHEHTQHPGDSNSFSGNFLRTLFHDHKGSILMAGQTGPIEKYDPNSNRFSRISIPQEIDPYEAFMDSDGTVWLGGVFGGLHKYDLKRKKYEKIDGFPGGTVHSIVEDKKKNLWIGSNAGLTRYNLITNKLDRFTKIPGDAESLSSNWVHQILIDIQDRIWLATGEGLNMMLKGTEHDIPKFRRWTTSQSGLPHDYITSIVEETDGTLWLACGNMISHFSPREETFKNYDQTDGLSGEQFVGAYYMVSKGLRSSSGNIFFSSCDGLIVFHPDSLTDNPFIPPVILTSFSINNQHIPIGGSFADTTKFKSPLERPINHEKSLKLTHKQNDFDIEFTALNFINPENNQYKYRLEPYETQWITTSGENRLARYTNISPGNYTFRVIASNNDGLWNQEGVSLDIIVTPPWWQTVWAYGGFVMVFFLVLFAWRRYDHRRLMLKHQAEQLAQLDMMKTRFFTNISHEFRTPITLLLGPLKEMSRTAKDRREKQTFSNMLQNGQRLLRLINQLLDLSKLEARKMGLRPKRLELVQFLEEVTASYESLAANKKIKYSFHSEVRKLIVYLDEEKIEKVIHNTLSNAFKFTNAGGKVTLHLKADNNHAVIDISDTGIGIPADQVEKVFDRFYQVESSHNRSYEGSGLGMSIAKELVELHHGHITARSKEGEGTTFTIFLPLGMNPAHANRTVDSKKEEPLESLYHDDDDIASETEITPDSSATPSEHPVVLIVEDNAGMRNYVRRILAEYHHISEAANGHEGLRKANEIIPDLIISDIMMPEMDGYALCAKIKSDELTSHIPVVLLTAKADHPSKLSGLEIGADDYLSKPFDADELRLIVRNRIEQRRRMRSKFSREITLEPSHVSIDSQDEKFLKRLLSLIQIHMEDETFSIEDFSHEAGYSRMQIYRKLKALTGQTPSQFVRTIRLKHAAQLLSRRADNVTQVAYSVGFGSIAYFNKCFKEQYGVTPGRFAASKSSKS